MSKDLDKFRQEIAELAARRNNPRLSDAGVLMDMAGRIIREEQGPEHFGQSEVLLGVDMEQLVRILQRFDPIVPVLNTDNATFFNYELGGKLSSRVSLSELTLPPNDRLGRQIEDGVVPGVIRQPFSRVINYLQRYNIRTVGQVRELADADLIQIERLGEMGFRFAKIGFAPLPHLKDAVNR